MARLSDFLYLDIERIKSLLSQLEGGVVTEVVENLKTSSQGKGGASLFSMIDIGGMLLTEKSREQTKTLRDALYIIFEDAASRQKLFADPERMSSVEAWKRGDIHAYLKESQLLKLTAPTRILDSKHFRQRVNEFMNWPRLIAGFTSGDELKTIANEKKRNEILDKKAAGIMGGADALQNIRRTGEFVESFMAGQILIRQFPCGPNRAEFSVVGMLNDSEGALQENRELLFGKYGYGVSNWTMVSQIAAIPSEDETITEFKAENLEISADEKSISRNTFEAAAVNMMQVMEGLGFAMGPKYPNISVTPLAVFREIVN